MLVFRSSQEVKEECRYRAAPRDQLTVLPDDDSSRRGAGVGARSRRAVQRQPGLPRCVRCVARVEGVSSSSLRFTLHSMRTAGRLLGTPSETRFKAATAKGNEPMLVRVSR